MLISLPTLFDHTDVLKPLIGEREKEVKKKKRYRYKKGIEGGEDRVESGRYNWRSVGRQKSRILVRNRCTSWRRSCTWRPPHPWERFRLSAPMPLLSSLTFWSNGHASSTLSARFVDVGRISCLLCHPIFPLLFFFASLYLRYSFALFYRLPIESGLLKGDPLPLGKYYHLFFG